MRYRQIQHDQQNTDPISISVKTASNLWSINTIHMILSIIQAKKLRFFCRHFDPKTLYLCQNSIVLLGHLHFLLHFFFTFMENLFKKHPIQTNIILYSKELHYKLSQFMARCWMITLEEWTAEARNFFFAFAKIS